MEKENELSLEKIKRKLTLIGNDLSRFSGYISMSSAPEQIDLIWSIS